jgi:hypothetical protein
MKKVNSLKTMSKLGGRAWSPIRSPDKDTFSRSKSTSSLPAVLEAARADVKQPQGEVGPKKEGNCFGDS